MATTIPLNDLRVQAKLKEEAYATAGADKNTEVHFELEVPYRSKLKKFNAVIKVLGTDCECVGRLLDSLKKGKAVDVVLGEPSQRDSSKLNRVVEDARKELKKALDEPGELPGVAAAEGRNLTSAAESAVSNRICGAFIRVDRYDYVLDSIEEA